MEFWEGHSQLLKGRDGDEVVKYLKHPKEMVFTEISLISIHLYPHGSQGFEGEPFCWLSASSSST